MSMKDISRKGAAVNKLDWNGLYELFVGANSSVIADTVSDWNGVPLGMLVLKRDEAILRQKANVPCTNKKPVCCERRSIIPAV